MDRAKVIAEEISWLIPKLLRGMRAGFMTSPQVTASQIITLMRIYENSPVQVGRLSKEMHVSAPTITGVIDRLVRSQYLRRIHSKTDRRVVNVELTDKGEKLVQVQLSEINKRWYAILRHLTSQDREDYIRILRRIVQVLGKEYE